MQTSVECLCKCAYVVSYHWSVQGSGHFEPGPLCPTADFLEIMGFTSSMHPKLYTVEIVGDDMMHGTDLFCEPEKNMWSRRVSGSRCNQITHQIQGADVWWQIWLTNRSGLGWKPDWWRRSRDRSHDGYRKPRPKPKPVASILKLGKPKPNPWLPKL